MRAHFDLLNARRAELQVRGVLQSELLMQRYELAVANREQRRKACHRESAIRVKSHSEHALFAVTNDSHFLVGLAVFFNMSNDHSFEVLEVLDGQSLDVFGLPKAR